MKLNSSTNSTNLKLHKTLQCTPALVQNAKAVWVKEKSEKAANTTDLQSSVQLYMK